MLLFFFNDTATTEIYTLSLHDALPISDRYVDTERIETDERFPDSPSLSLSSDYHAGPASVAQLEPAGVAVTRDRKSTRLNSSHANISYAVFCLKKKTTEYCAEAYDQRS